MRTTLALVGDLLRVLPAAFLAATLCLPPAEAGEHPASAGAPRAKIGLALGGGGAKGAAHIGVLKVLEQMRIPVDYVAGTSMGAIVGALYASGMSADELEKTLTSVDWDEVFSDSPPRQDIEFRRKREDLQILSKLEVGYGDGRFHLPKGLIQGQKVNLLFETMLIHVNDITDFDRLPIPYRAVAADIETGQMVVIGSGNLADAARASMSVPGVFPPVDVSGRYLIDGGIVRNLPVDIVRGMGAEVVIAVDVGKPLLKRDELGSPLSILSQMLDIMIQHNVSVQIESLGPRDAFIRPDLGDISSADFKRGAEAARLGEEAALAKGENLARYAISPAEYQAFLAGRHRPSVPELTVGSVHVEGTKRVSKEYVESKLDLRPGDVLDIAKLKHEVGVIYGTGDFDRVDLLLDRKGDAYDVTVKTTEKPWSNVLRMGFSLAYDFEGDNDFSILLDYTMRNLNSLGAEWKNQFQIGRPLRLYSEFYQPLDYSRFFFVMPRAGFRKDYFNVFNGKQRVAQYQVKTYEAVLDVGIQPWTYGQVTAGILFGGANVKAQIGEPEVADNHVRRGALTATVIADQLDSVTFPRHGYFGVANIYSSLRALGADNPYNRASISLSGAYTRGKNTLVGQLRAGTHIGNDLPQYDLFPLGGFLNLSGMSQNQLVGQQLGYASLVAYRQIGKSLLGAFYVGGSIEAGNVWKAGQTVSLGELVYAGSAFLGFDTPIGPLYLGYGHAEGGFNAVYLFLGSLFRADR